MNINRVSIIAILTNVGDRLSHSDMPKMIDPVVAGATKYFVP